MSTSLGLIPSAFAWATTALDRAHASLQRTAPAACVYSDSIISLADRSRSRARACCTPDTPRLATTVTTSAAAASSSVAQNLASIFFFQITTPTARVSVAQVLLRLLKPLVPTLVLPLLVLPLLLVVTLVPL